MRALVKDKRIHDEGKSRVLLERMETEYAHVEDMCRELVNDSQPEVIPTLNSSCLQAFWIFLWTPA